MLVIGKYLSISGNYQSQKSKHGTMICNIAEAPETYRSAYKNKNARSSVASYKTDNY